MNTKHILTLLITMLLASCATTSSTDVPMKPEHRSAIRTVSISPEVKQPAPMSYMDLATRTKASLAGAPLGLIGALFIAPAVMKSASKDHPKAKELEQAMARNGIRVDQLVRDAFLQELRSGSALKVAASGGDAVFKLTFGYGLSVGSGAFATKLSPNLAVSAELVRADGTVAWKQTRLIYSDAKSTVVIGVKGANIGRGHAHSHDELMSNPQLLRDAFEASAQAAAKQLVADLQAQP